ncbi:MAG TPA: AMP-dependent synthetase [Cyanobacteria bacterium UBA11149]|nr:AMP-dependent synthetase [Cyanobacteria bacterium UBA11367]HBE59920.1 AMP-dependent synthetase [Cyanobacteria bacterium UBA11366]HBK64698.1 AMP-dependent synthetase [Cyanobacteria bacterium UBA11166]HBR75876.1 AMP-dependent synthetase [Cyanobacteria bacterium UBA11159]HBS69298.1 AMP-dependent synthetase [Cyanobacteria bacterium UBA11153]HBW90425.1 AMP-dependent synthetase [Cyanobacteria bacterium UBA11149]HCA96653.1 AMP-dependent synthetase [Cyanobacteria bacterium UBA9226]
MNILGQVLSSPSSRTNILTDGQINCSYQEIPDIFKNIDALFVKQGIDKKDTLVLEAVNTLPNALILLYLLARGYSFLPINRGVNPANSSIPQVSIPRFCRYSLVTQPLKSSDNRAALTQPESFLQFLKNEEWISNSHRENNSTQKLYLRTSGSTGKPKLAVHTHSHLLENAMNCVERLGLKSDDRIAIPVPLAHMFGLGAAFLPGVAVGASIDLQQGANLLRYLQRETAFAPNVAFMTPIFCDTLLKGRKSAREYRLTVTAGDRLKEETFTQFQSRFGCVVNLYGSTEMGAIAASAPDYPNHIRSKTSGKPMRGVILRTQPQNPESLTQTDNLGEIWCQHQYGFEGYVDEDGIPVRQNLPIQDDWFNTRDLGRITEDGCIEVFGRCDHSINRNGLLVFFADVEKGMEKIEGIEQVVVVSKGESQRGKGLVAYCVTAKSANLNEDEIRSSCFNILPRHSIPDSVFLVKSLPLLPNGKVDRQTLINKNDSKPS